MGKIKLDFSLPKNLPLLLKQRVSECGTTFLQAAKDKTGKFVYYTFSQVYDQVIALAHALKSIGINRGENIALISDNRREWIVTDQAIMSLGCADVPRGTDSVAKEIRFIVSYSDCKTAFFENIRQFKKILEKAEDVPLLKNIILFDKPKAEETEELKKSRFNIYIFEDFIKKGIEIVSKNKQKKQKEIELEMEKTNADDTCTMIFTSGTTGEPKGVMLSHRNYMTQLSAVPSFMPCKQGDFWLSVLPVWHAFERLIQYVPIQLKCGIAYSKPVASVMLKDMETIKPQWMCGVPRLWEALASGVNKAMKKKGGFTLKLYNFFLSIGIKYKNAVDKVKGNVCRLKKHSRFLDFLKGIIPAIFLHPLYKLGNILVFRKLRKKFGGNLSIAISGGGALQKETDDFYRAVGLNLLEGYGLTETCPVISFRHYKKPRPGCVGAIFPTMEVKLLKEEHGIVTDNSPLPPGKQGLIFVRSKQIMKGYYKRPDLTSKVIDSSGWFNTGDLGILTMDNELKITGRAKDTIVLSGGENVEPDPIECTLNGSDYIENSIVLGQDKKYLAALIVPSKEMILKYAEENQIASANYEELLQSEKIQKLFTDEINSKICPENGFKQFEKISKFTLLPESFKIGEELSAKQEIMRYKINEKYKDIIEKMF